MLDFAVESPKRFLNEIVTLAEPGKTTRMPGDRRAAQPGAAPSSGIKRKRRRHDNLACAKPGPLQW